VVFGRGAADLPERGGAEREEPIELDIEAADEQRALGREPPSTV
jgi:hypothetical protein